MELQTSSTLFFLFILILPFATSLSFNFSSFGQNTLGSIDFQGDAFLNQVIQLTKNELDVTITDSTGRAVYHEPLLCDSDTGEVTDFTTHFSFIINSFNNSLYGDGLAFFLAPYPSVLPNFLSGSNLGLFSQESAHSASSNTLVAVEFDTSQNEWDPSPDHVGVNINSIESVATRMWKTSIKDGQIANAWVSYKANTKNLSVFLTFKEKPVFHGNSSLSYAFDLKEILSDKVAIGFSASTVLEREKYC